LNLSKDAFINKLSTREIVRLKGARLLPQGTGGGKMRTREGNKN